LIFPANYRIIVLIRDISITALELVIIGLLCVKRHANGMNSRGVLALHFAGDVLQGLH
jgi:hypothetical protein